MNANPEIENWVKLRHECSPLEIFIRLQHGAEEDVKTRNSLRGVKTLAEFRILSEDRYFTVIRDVKDEFGSVHRLALWVQFAWDKTGITVKTNGAKNVQKATLTLADDAECKLKLESGEELSCSQFRKRFLEDLFFNF